jgi:cytochrome c oxidase subunit 2
MTDTGVARDGAGEARHGLRIFWIWLVLSVVVDVLIWFVWGPHIPPGNMTSSAASQQTDFKVLSVVAAPVMLLLYVYFGYALTFWRQREGDEEDGPAELPGAARIQKVWISVTTALVLGLFVFGTVQLVSPAGAGAGEGSHPAWKPNGKPLQVQVIAQQWLFTYRYPAYGGMETSQLVLPVNQPVQFNVTSLDVIHSFWAIQLGVKADAVQDHAAAHRRLHREVRRAVWAVARRDVRLRQGRVGPCVRSVGEKYRDETGARHEDLAGVRAHLLPE